MMPGFSSALAGQGKCTGDTARRYQEFKIFRTGFNTIVTLASRSKFACADTLTTSIKFHSRDAIADEGDAGGAKLTT
jgi:hypothetical protein